MKTIDNIIKALVIAGSLMLGGCHKQEPVNQRVITRVATHEEVCGYKMLGQANPKIYFAGQGRYQRIYDAKWFDKEYEEGDEIPIR